MLCVKALQLSAAAIQADKKIALEAVKRKGGALQFVAAELQADKEIVLEAVKQDGLAIKHAAPGLRGDKDVVAEAVKQNAEALQYSMYAAPDLRADTETAGLAAIRREEAGGEDRPGPSKRPRLDGGGASYCGRCRRAVVGGR